jgi:uncharacterized protein (DUF1330 family)
MKTHYAIGLAIFSAMAGAGLVQTLHAQGKPKAYVIAEIEVTDAARFKPYLDGTAVIVPQAGGRFLARGNKTFTLAGAPPKPVIAVVEWDSFEQAQAFLVLTPTRSWFQIARQDQTSAPSWSRAGDRARR